MSACAATIRRCGLLLAPLALAAGCGQRGAPHAVPVSPVARQTAAGAGPLQLEANVTEALERARAEGRPALLFFTAEGCPYCRQMRSEALADPQVLALARGFVCLEVRWGSDAAGDALCRKYEIRAVPSIVLLSPEGTMVKRTAGVQPGRSLAVAMHTALRLATRQAARGGAPRR